MLTEEEFEQVEELIAELIEQASAGALVIVEGADDVLALSKLGIKGKIQKLSEGKSLLHLLEELAGPKDIIIMTDFDREGERLANFCAEHLKRLGANPITEYREKLKSLVRKEVKDIEGLGKIYQKHWSTQGDSEFSSFQ